MRHYRQAVCLVSSLIAACIVLGLAPLRRAPMALPPRLTFGLSRHLSDPSRYPLSDTQYGGQPLPDDEPSLTIGPDGTVWVVALHLHYGTALWRGRFGAQTPTFIGLPDRGIGGTDAAVALGSGATPTLYTASLVPITAPTLAWRISTTACPAGAVTHTFAACTYYPHLAFGRRDRPWLAATGPATAYLSYATRHDDLLSGQMTVQRTGDGGLTWLPVGDPLAALTGVGAAPLHGWPGPLVVNQQSGTVYEVFVTETPGRSEGRFDRLVVAASRDGGVTWSTTVAYQGAAGEDDANMWPALAIDSAGTLYVAWSDRHRVSLTVSRDGGTTWSSARRIDRPADAVQSSVLPWITAGAAGRVALAWYGSGSGDALSPQARWQVIFARSDDGGSSFEQVAATGVIHRGPLCTKGDACPWTARQLLDTLGVALDPRTGRAAIVYARSTGFGDYTGCRAAANCPQVYYVEQQGP